jgi:hypothetical protein
LLEYGRRLACNRTTSAEKKQYTNGKQATNQFVDLLIDVLTFIQHGEEPRIPFPNLNEAIKLLSKKKYLVQAYFKRRAFFFNLEKLA